MNYAERLRQGNTDSTTMIGAADEIDRLQASNETLRENLQTEGNARVKAEGVIALIAQSTTGDYDWCCTVCRVYLDMPEPELDIPLERSWELIDRAAYLNRCASCGKDFLGGKRRIICRLCASEPDFDHGDHADRP